jgi:uncharacterized protein (TIGR03000 family)
MFRSTNLHAVLLVAAGALLGYAAAAGKLSFFQKADAAAPAAAAAAPAQEEEQVIVFEVRLPGNALLEFDGVKTSETGEVRAFRTPPLAVGRPYSYTLKATAGGKTVTRQIQLRHGASNSIDLRPDFLAASGVKQNAGAPAHNLALTNVRSTFGIQGPTRTDNKFLPDDTLFLSFEIAGAQVSSGGKVRYSVGLDATDDAGNLQFRQVPHEREVEAPAAGKSLAAYASIHIGLDQPPGDYKVKVTVTDLVAGERRDLTYPFQVLPRGFGIVGLMATADSEGRVPALAFHAGQSYWLRFDLVGFSRDKTSGQPNLAVTLGVTDQQGRAALPKPLTGEINRDVAPKVPVVPAQFVLRLQQPGTFTVELTASDKASGQNATLSFPLTMLKDGPAATARRAGVATGVTGTGTLLRRGQAGTDWDAVPEKESIHAGDVIVGLPGASLDSRNGAVRLTLHTDLDRESTYPALESAVRLEPPGKADLEFTLDRGRVELSNRKQTGPAHVRVHLRQDTWDLTLAKPGTRVALEIFSRWPRGVASSLNPGPGAAPVARAVLLVLQGEVHLKQSDQELALKAPPGPALVEWDSVYGGDDTPQRLEKLPSWASEGHEDTPASRARSDTVKRLGQALAAKSVDATLTEFVSADEEKSRRAAVFLMGALDKLGPLAQALRAPKHPDVWDNGVLALRQWIGRGPGQDQVLANALIEHGGLSSLHAAAALYLLHSPGDAELARPEYYQALIDYLDHDVPLLRRLAYWHLYRLVPAGRELGYNPLDAKEARAAAIQKWRKLVPRGKLPPGVSAEAGRPK